jgi:hypothetical protein
LLLRCSVAKAERRQKSHSALSDAERGGVRDALAALALRHAAAGPPARPVLTQLALALATLLIKWDALEPAAVLPAACAALGGGADAHSRVATLALLRLLPEEVATRELSVHPARRAAVADALRRDAPAVVASLDSAAAADVQEAPAAAMEAAAAWMDFAAGQPGVAAAVAASPLAAHAFAALAAGGPEATLQPALVAASAAATALLAEPGAAGAAALAPLLRALRPAAAGAPAASPAGCAAAALLSHVAAEAAPRAARGDTAAAAVLAEATDALLDAVARAPGPLPEPPLTWLSPWSATRDAIGAADAAPGGGALISAAMAPAAARLAALACARTLLPADAAAFPGEDDDDSVRGEFSDALRDAAALAGAAVMLEPLAAALHAAQQQPWRCAEAAAFCAAAVARQLPADAACPAAEALCAAAASMLPHPQPRAAGSAAALLGALGPWLGGAARDDVAAAACAALERGVASAEPAAARSACIALMRASEAGAAARFAAAGAAPRLAAMLAAGGPTAPPRGTLRPGQEPAFTVLLRAAACLASRAPGPAAALAALLGTPMRAAEVALAALGRCAGGEDADAAAQALAESLRDIAVVVDSSARCGAAAHVTPTACAVLGPAAAGGAANEAAAAELCGLLWAVANAMPEHCGDAASAAAAAYAHGRQPAFLALLARLVAAASAACGRDGSAPLFPEAVARAAVDAAGSACGDGNGQAARDAGAPLLRLLSACAAAAVPLAAPGAMRAACAACAACLQLTSGDDARAACALAAALLTSAPLLTSPEGDALGAHLTHALLRAANGALPPDAVSVAAGALHAGWRAGGDVRAAAWLQAALADPELPRRGTAPKAKAEFLAALLEPANAADERRFKRALKAFCGGKKKGQG